MFNFFSKKAEIQPLFFKTDIHCHVLPGIDDGAQTVDEAVALVQAMQRWGIERIIASPHVTFETFENNQETTDAAMAHLQQALDAKNIKIELSHSAENRLDDLFAKNFEEGTLMSMPNKLLLIENSFMLEPWNLEQTIFDLQMKGFVPILAHPERYSYYHVKKDRYDTLHNAGAEFQINLLSLAGHYGKQEKKIAEWLIDKGYVRYIGTDLHRQAHVEAIDRYLATKDYQRHRDALAPRILNDRIGR